MRLQFMSRLSRKSHEFPFLCQKRGQSGEKSTIFHQIALDYEILEADVRYLAYKISPQSSVARFRAVARHRLRSLVAGAHFRVEWELLGSRCQWKFGDQIDICPLHRE